MTDKQTEEQKSTRLALEILETLADGMDTVNECVAYMETTLATIRREAVEQFKASEEFAKLLREAQIKGAQAALHELYLPCSYEIKDRGDCANRIQNLIDILKKGE